MKKYAILFVAATSLLLSCKKDSSTTPGGSTTNNTTVAPSNVLPYTIDGIHDIYLSAGSGNISMPITVTYHNSDQQTVTVSVSGMPDFIRISADYAGFSYLGPWVGRPTFTIPLSISSYSGPYVRGIYPITITVVGSVSGSKTVTFNITCQ